MTMIHCNVYISYGNDYIGYAYSLSGASGTYRTRLFMDYAQVSSFTSTGYGLTSNAEGSTYDDWMSSFRPARVDSRLSNGHTCNFNTEICVPIASAGTTSFNLLGLQDGDAIELVRETSSTGTYTVGGASCIAGGEHVDSPAIVVERRLSSVEIESIEYIGGTVYVVTGSAHGFSTGDAITVSGLPTSGNHTIGVSGERYNGTFVVTVTGESTFTYTTGNYSSGSVPSYSGIGAASKWEVVPYTRESCTISGSATDDTTVVVSVGQHEFEVGDYVSLYSTDNVLSNVEVVKTTDTSITVSLAPLYVSIDGTYTMVYTPRMPSASIPVNSPYSDDTDDYVTNSTRYSHTVNTSMLYPVVDTYFDKLDGTNNDRLPYLESSADATICMKFTSGFIVGIEDGSAELTMYVNSDTISKCSLVMYQMSDTNWSSNMTYDSIKSHVTQNIIAPRVELVNPSMTSGPLGYVKFSIPNDIVAKWLSGTSGYPSAVAIQVKTASNGYVRFNSSEADSFRPFITVSGGAKAAVDPDLIDITPSVSHAMPGEMVRLEATGDGTFSDYTYGNHVYFVKGSTEVEATIVTGNSNYIDIVVPGDLNGNYSVVVYSEQPGGKTLQITDEMQFYVDGDPQLRNRKLAEKIIPGNYLADDISYNASYNRDLSYSNFTEITDGNSLIQNIYSILLTRKGERMFNPSFGTTIEDRIFELGAEDSEISILQECISAISAYERRVKVDVSASSVEAVGDNGIRVNLAVVLPGNHHEILHLSFKSRGVEL